MPKKISQHPNKPDYFLMEKAVLQYEEIRKDKPELKDFFQSTSQAIAVLGAGPSLPEDMQKLPEDRLEMSCNHHAFRVCTPDYMVFLDSPDSHVHSDEFKDLVKNPKCTRISYKLLDYTDIYTINEFPQVLDPIGDTGMFATWLACYITSGPVYLCGMNVDRRGQEHFYEAKESEGWQGKHLENKIRKWGQVLTYCENPGRVKSISGPLTDLV